MPPHGSKWAFSTDDLSIYERADPDEFDLYDYVDSTTITESGFRDPRDLGVNDGH